jgi:D-lactate dehydrogenase
LLTISESNKTFYARIFNFMDVFFYEVFDEEKQALLRYLPSTWTCGFTDLTIQEAEHSEAPAPVISIRTQSIIPLRWSSQLSGILSRSAGFDHLNRFQANTDATVACGHLFRYSGRAVAEHAAMLWLCLLRRLPRQQAAISNFQRDHLTGCECHGRTLAVFGVGDIGHHVVEVGRGLGMRVIGVDLVARFDDVDYVDRATAVARADVVVCAMNLNETNDGYFTPAVLASCKPGVIFINVARGEFALNSHLLDALRAGHLGGAGLDVYAAESVIATSLRSGTTGEHPELLAFHALLQRDDVIMTPHNAFNTTEAIARKSEQSVQQLAHFFQHGVFSTHLVRSP